MSLRTKIITLFAALTFLGASACNTGSDKKRCETNYDCPTRKVCIDDFCVEENQSEFLSVGNSTTDQNGEANLNIGGRNFPIKAENEQGSSLAGVELTGYSDGIHYLIIGSDPRSDYFTEWNDESIVSLEVQIESNFTTIQQPLLLDVILTFKSVYDFGSDTRHFIDVNKPELLREDENTTKYCITMEQLNNNYIQLPANIILFIAKQVGVVNDESVEEINRSVIGPIKWLYENFIKLKFGEQPGYIISVPKFKPPVCSYFTDDGMLCVIDDQELAQKLFDDYKAIVIEGPCTPGSACEDECNYGERGCYANNVEICEQFDCTEWVFEESCDGDQYCENGSCLTGNGCVDDCNFGEIRCDGDNIERCSDYDSDDCSEWGFDRSCDGEQYCEDGECVNNSGCNPTQNCSEPGCVLYEEFDGNSLNTDCGWWGRGDYSVSGGVISLNSDTTSILIDLNEIASCDGDSYLEARVKFIGTGTYQISSEDFQVGFTNKPGYESFISCNGNIVDIGRIIHNDWNDVKMKKEGSGVELLVNGVHYGELDCSTFGTVMLGNYSSGTEFKIDLVRFVCNN